MIKKDLQEKARANFINFQPFPVIDGYISIKKDEESTIGQFKLFMNKLSISNYHIRKAKDRKRYARIKISIKSLKYAMTQGLFNNCGIQLASKAIFKLESQRYPKDIFKAFNELEFIKWREDQQIFKVEFNWQTENIYDIVHCLKNIYPKLIISQYDENTICSIRYCAFNNIYLNELQLKAEALKNAFPSMLIFENYEKGSVYFRQFYTESEQAYRIREIIKEELQDLDPVIISYKLYDVEDAKEKYIFEIDTNSKKEAQSSAVKELRGTDFCVGKNDFGKLFRVNYPNMIFDISGDNLEKTKLLFESKTVSSIEPNLIGDIEKISRLKNSLNNILNGENLQNPNLKDFIFDAKKATKIDDIEYHTNPLSDTFQELNNHLLNSSINEPQKQAIIKTLLAKDLALIQGPPGTGKSTAIAEIIWQHIRQNPKERILLTSETNLAVDNAIDRIVNKNHNLVKPIRIGSEEKLEMEGRQFSLDVMKQWVEKGSVEINKEEQDEDEESLSQKLILQNWIDNILGRIEKTELDETIFSMWDNLLTNPTKEIRHIFYNNYIKKLQCNWRYL